LEYENVSDEIEREERCIVLEVAGFCSRIPKSHEWRVHGKVGGKDTTARASRKYLCMNVNSIMRKQQSLKPNFGIGKNVSNRPPPASTKTRPGP
jgi:hypothetical protein